MKINELKAKTVWIVLLIVTAAHAANAFYNPDAGRWLNRDPIEEDGGLALYVLAANEPLSSFDILGAQSAGANSANLMPNLVIAENSAPVKDVYCGEFFWQIKWGLTIPSGLKTFTGFIMQKVLIEWDIKTVGRNEGECDTKPDQIHDMPARFSRRSSPNRSEYWEYWTVSYAENRGVVIEKEGFDEFTWGIQPNTSGSVKWTGEAYLVKDRPVPINDRIWAQGKVNGTLAGELRSVPIVDDKPTFAGEFPPLLPTGEAPTPIDHTLEIGWNCCGGIIGETDEKSRSPR